jgi:hypothetical protein
MTSIAAPLAGSPFAKANAADSHGRGQYEQKPEGEKHRHNFFEVMKYFLLHGSLCLYRAVV